MKSKKFRVDWQEFVSSEYISRTGSVFVVRRMGNISEWNDILSVRSGVDERVVCRCRQAVHLAPHWLQVRSWLMASLPRPKDLHETLSELVHGVLYLLERWADRRAGRLCFFVPVIIPVHPRLFVSRPAGRSGQRETEVARLGPASLIDCAYRCLQWNAGSLFFPMAWWCCILSTRLLNNLFIFD